MGLRFLKKELLIPLVGKRKVRDLDLRKYKLNLSPGKSLARHKKEKQRLAKNAKARARRKVAKKNGRSSV